MVGRGDGCLLTGRLEHESHDIAGVIRLHGDDVLVARALEHLGLLTYQTVRGSVFCLIRGKGVERVRRGHRGAGSRRRAPSGGDRKVLTFAIFSKKTTLFFPEPLARSRKDARGAPEEDLIWRGDRAGAVSMTHHVGEVHAHGHVAVAAVVLEAVRSEEEGHEGDVGGVHRLEREAVVGAVEVGVGDEILDGLEHLLQEGTLDETGLKHGDLCMLVCVSGVRVPAWNADGAKIPLVFGFEFLDWYRNAFRNHRSRRGFDTRPRSKCASLREVRFGWRHRRSETDTRARDDGLDDDGQRGRRFPEHGRAPQQEGESRVSPRIVAFPLEQSTRPSPSRILANPPQRANSSRPSNPNRPSLIRHHPDSHLQGRCLLYTSPSPRDQRGSRMPSSA